MITEPGFLPVALNVPGVDNEYTQHGTFNRQRTIQFGPDGQTRQADLGDGRGWDGSVSGLTFDLDLNDNWSLSDSLNYTDGDADTIGFVPNGGAVNVGALIANPALDAGAVITGPLSGAVSGGPVGGSAFIQQFGTWEVRKQIQSFTNNLALSGQLRQL